MLFGSCFVLDSGSCLSDVGSWRFSYAVLLPMFCVQRVFLLDVFSREGETLEVCLQRKTPKNNNNI